MGCRPVREVLFTPTRLGIFYEIEVLFDPTNRLRYYLTPRFRGDVFRSGVVKIRAVSLRINAKDKPSFSRSPRGRCSIAHKLYSLDLFQIEEC